MVDVTQLSERQEKLLTCLQPFEAVLAEKVQLQHRIETLDAGRSETDAFVWLRVENFMVPIDRHLLEGVELFALLAYVDWKLWKQCVLRIWPQRSSRWEDSYALRPSDVGMHVNYREYTWSEEVYELLATTSHHYLSSSECQEARRIYLDVLSAKGKSVNEIPMRFLRDDYGMEDHQLEKVSQLIKRHAQLCVEATNAAGCSDSHYVGLRVRTVELFSISEKVLDASRLAYGAEIVDCGIHIQYLGTHPSTTVLQKYPHEYMDAIVKLFPAGDGDSIDTGRAVGVERVRIGGHVNTEDLPVAMAAVAASTCVKALEFAPKFRRTKAKPDLSEDHRLLWSWFAYYILRKPPVSVGHRLHHMRLNVGTLHPIAFDGVTSILDSANPCALLFGQGGSDMAAETVSASQFALLDPFTKKGRALPKWSSSRMLKELPVITRGEEWTSVMLPHWGQAWVSNDDVVASHQVVHTPEVLSIPDVCLVEVETDAADPIRAFLRLIGNGIKCLRIHVSDQDSGSLDDLVGHIFEVCPNLESLHVEVYRSSPMNLLPVLDAFVSGVCKLERLELFGVSIADAQPELKTFVDALADRHHPANQFLKVFTVNELSFAAITDAVVDSCLVMLAKNYRLEQFGLGVYWRSADDEDRKRECYETFKAFDGQEVHHYATSSKIAFLSAVASPNDRRSVLADLDVQVISLIFDFAASSHRRRVSVAAPGMNHFGMFSTTVEQI